MNCLKLIILTLLIALLSSCAVTSRYEKAVKDNSITTYRSYLTDFPKSKYKEDIEKRLNTLLDEEAWKNALRSNTIQSYENYIYRFPNGNYVNLASEYKRRIEYDQTIKAAWDEAERQNTLLAYQTFLESYPSSTFSYLAKMRIIGLEEKAAWDDAKQRNTVDSYNSYLYKYPNGENASAAKRKLEELENETYRPFWNAAQTKNTIGAYEDFCSKYPMSSFVTQAKEKIGQLKEAEWQKALKKNSISGFKDFIKKYPESNHIAEAEKRIIDLEVDQIFKGDHGELPPLSRNSYGTNSSPTSTIEIFNNTEYLLTIWYSGIKSQKIVLPPYQRRKTELPNGKYRAAASVNTPNVDDYAGNETLIGGEYEVEYYIVTERR